jgi:hypothetical protein
MKGFLIAMLQFLGVERSGNTKKWHFWLQISFFVEFIGGTDEFPKKWTTSLEPEHVATGLNIPCNPRNCRKEVMLGRAIFKCRNTVESILLDGCTNFLGFLTY